MFAIAGRTDLGAVERLTLGSRVLGIVPMPVHCYRIGSTLVDAGPPKRVRDLIDLVDPDAIEHVVLTHHHEDHVGGARRLADAGATVHAPKTALHALETPPKLEPYQRRVWGKPEPVDAEPLANTVSTPDVELEVHPVPGHSPDHVALFEPEERWLFAGDAFLPERDTLRADEDLAGFVDSLDTMRKLAPDRILPGHGSVVDEPKAAIDAVIEHFEDLTERAQGLAQEGHSARTVRRKLLGLEGLMRYYTGGHYAKQNLVDEALAMDL